MEIKLLHSHYDEEHYEEVKAEMLSMGAPTIKAVWVDWADYYQALEGSHRIRAAKELGLVPVIDEVEYSEIRDTHVGEIKYMDLDNDYTIDELIDGCMRESVSVNF